MLLPQFNLDLPQIPSQLKKMLEDQREVLDKFLQQQPYPDFTCLITLLEQQENTLQCFWSPIAHLHAVVSTAALREIYQACLPLLTAHATALGQHEGLYRAFQHLKDQPGFANFSAQQQRVIELRLRDFRLAGVALPPTAKARFAEIEQSLATLGSQFGEHVLDATQQWHYLTTDDTELAGLPDRVLQQAQQLAQQHQQRGFRLTLDFPCYRAVQQYAENRNLREKFYQAYVTRASEFGDAAQDNTALMQQILALHYELAQLLGYANYAELSLATKMAHHPQQVLDFLQDLARQAKPIAEKEFHELQQFAGHPLAAWDIAYYAEKLSQQRYHLNQEALRPYFPLPRVLDTLFSTVQQLFGLRIELLSDIIAWHPEVDCYQIYDKHGKKRGIFYLDLYVREQKREGAWMDDYCARWQQAEICQQPVAFLTCNFARPQGDQPALLTHDDMITLFHEFGHGLHHLLTTIDYLDINGLHHVPWDAVEFPSQFLENWCWQREILAHVAHHYATNAPLPPEKLEQLLASRHFHAGLQLVRQLEFALFDFYLHLEAPQGNAWLLKILQRVREQTAVYAVPDYYRMPNTFSHVFDGGYAAGYYSYLWAEVLAADAFELFAEKGILNSQLGQHFVDHILSQGGSQNPDRLFRNFRGRDPNPQALLRSWGLTAAPLG